MTSDTLAPVIIFTSVPLDTVCHLTYNMFNIRIELGVLKMSLETRVEKLEKEVRLLKDELALLKKGLQGKKQTDTQINVVDDYMIKLVYTGIYAKIKDGNSTVIGFPKNRRKLAEQISVGQKMFIYVTSPVKKIIGLMRVVKGIEESTGRWPYIITLNWEIGPKQGIGFADIGLQIRPRVGDTLYAITNEKAKEIIDLLNEQQDLPKSTIDFLASEYGD